MRAGVLSPGHRIAFRCLFPTLISLLDGRNLPTAGWATRVSISNMMICDVMLGDGDWGIRPTPQRKSSFCTRIPVSVIAARGLARSNRLIVNCPGRFQVDSSFGEDAERGRSNARWGTAHRLNNGLGLLIWAGSVTSDLHRRSVMAWKEASSRLDSTINKYNREVFSKDFAI